MFCFNAAWTTLFATAYILFYVDGGRYVLANVASSVVWLFVTAALWVRGLPAYWYSMLTGFGAQGVAAGVMHDTRTGGACARVATISRCRQSLTVEAIGWAEFGLCVIALVGTCAWVWSERWRRRWNPKQDVEGGSQTQLVGARR